MKSTIVVNGKEIEEEVAPVNIKGKDYVPVHERVRLFHKHYPKGKITTQYKGNDGKVIWAAIAVPEVENHDRYFTGHSFSKPNQEKDFEKAETSAIGRALANLGIAVEAGIASSEEMELFYEGNPIANQKKIDTAKETGGVCQKCGAKELISKNGKPYCSKTCWLDKGGKA